MGDLAFTFVVSRFCCVWQGAKGVLFSSFVDSQEAPPKCCRSKEEERKEKNSCLGWRGGRVGKWWVAGVRRTCEQTE